MWDSKGKRRGHKLINQCLSIRAITSYLHNRSTCTLSHIGGRESSHKAVISYTLSFKVAVSWVWAIVSTL